MRYVRDNKTIIEAQIKDSLYIVKYIADKYSETVFKGAEKLAESANLSRVVERYNLYYRRFDYLGPRKLRYLYERTTLKDRIVILSKKGIYYIYKLIKLRNKILKKLVRYKASCLKRIYLDIYSLLLILL